MTACDGPAQEEVSVPRRNQAHHGVPLKGRRAIDHPLGSGTTCPFCFRIADRFAKRYISVRRSLLGEQNCSMMTLSGDD